MGATNADRRLLARRFELRRHRLLSGREIVSGAHRFWRVAWDTNVTGMSAMLAYNMLLAVVPVALLGAVRRRPGAVERGSAAERAVGPAPGVPGRGRAHAELAAQQIRSSTTSTGVLALIASLWLGSSFWGALDTAFSRIYGCPSRNWLEQKRFALAMLGVVLRVHGRDGGRADAAEHPRGGRLGLPFDLAHVAVVVYVISLAISLVLLFGCLMVIYSRVPEPRRARGGPCGRGRSARRSRSGSSTTRSPRT